MIPRDPKLVQTAANTIRFLAADAVEQANSGHPGMPMGMADCAFVLFDRFVRHDPTRPDWPGRDRFVLSAGHGSMLLYALLHLSGYDLSLDELKRFRQWGSRTPGHPERGCVPGVETTTGPLGQGLANGVGMALAAKLLSARLSTADFAPLDYRVFAIVSDGDLMEGVAAEAASLAGHWKLGNLVTLYDDNRISIEGSTELAFTEDVGRRFEAYGWHVQRIDGHDHDQLYAAIERATEVSDQPSMLIARTHIAYGSPGKQDTADAHGAPLGPDELRATKKAMGWPLEPSFHVPEPVRELFAARTKELAAERMEWEERFHAWREANADKAELWDRLFQPTAAQGLLGELVAAAGDQPAATRVLSGRVLQKAAALFPGLLGGSADLAPSTKTSISGQASVRAADFSARNLHFGVREHAMGAILNGMSLAGGVIPYGGTFLVFADYMRPPIRLASLMELGNIYVFTHDSIFVGEDGPTHQPIEQLASLRCIPGLVVIRPADPVETAAAWTLALQRRQAPTALALTRQKLPLIERPAGFQPEDVLRGAYTVVDERAGRRAVVVATGSELAAAAAAAGKLGIRCVSMPSVELFLTQPESWRRQLIPDDHAVAVVEASFDPGWSRICGPKGLVIGMDRFGASAPAGELAQHFGFTEEAIYERLATWLKG